MQICEVSRGWRHLSPVKLKSLDYSFANGDISSSDNKSDAGVFSPGSDSPFQQDFSTFTDNHTLSDTNANVATKVDTGTMGNLVLDSPPGYTAESSTSQSTFSGEGVTPMTGIQYTGDSNSSGQDAESSNSDGSLSGDQLRQVLKNQLESYFSRESLSSDTYLQSQMDADQYVPIATVANLDQIQKLTSDMPLIVDVLRESTFVQVDEKGEKVRPNLNRCIVILREIPDSTPVKEVQDLFSGQNCPKFVNCEFAHNDNWYVTFDSDADAQRAYQYLREEVKTFQGKPIMARIKAKPLIRTYQPRNGYINKRYQQQPAVGPQLTEVVTSSAAPQQQFTATQPFTIMPNVPQYPLSGQQAMPFYPPPNPLLQTWPTASPTMLDPSMVSSVLAMNGYQATQVKDYSSVTNRNPFNNINRNNSGRQMSSFSRNQKMHGNPQMSRDRVNSNESLPPRLQHQHDRQNSATNNLHKTSPRNLDNNSQISNSVPVYHRRMEGHGGHMGHINHGSHSNQQSHMGPPHHVQHQQHLDSANNNNSMPNSRGSEPVSQRYPVSSKPNSYSYKSRRRRDEDGARPNRVNSSQSSQRDNIGSGGPPVGRKTSIDKFDYEPTSFPPLPGSGNNTNMGEKYENKLSDVVKGTAKMAAKEPPAPLKSTPPAPPPAVTSTTSASTTMVTPTTASTHTTTQVNNSWESKENRDTTTSCSQSSSSPVCSGGSPAPPTQHTTKSSSGTASTHSVSNQVRSTSKPQEVAVSDPISSDKPVVQQQSSIDDKTASVSAASVKLSYAQMVQRTKVAEVSAGSMADGSDGSDSDGADTPLQQSNKANVTLKEQGQHSSPSSAKSSARGSIKDFSRKDSREEHEDGKRDDHRKENDYRRDEPPREQRMGSRRAKENRERRFGDRDNWRRNDRRDRDGLREGPRTAVAK